MEPQLVEYLPSDSNIVQFQSRFDHFTDCRTADADPVHYVFGRQFGSGGDTRAFLDQLPQDTMLQRAIVTVLRSGSHWHTRTGWSRIAAPTDAGGGPEPLGADSSAQETGE